VYKLNELVDCLDTCSEWLHARVLAVNMEEKKIQVRYVGYTSRWDEWVEVGSPRLAEYQTKLQPAMDGRRQVFPFAKKVSQFEEVTGSLKGVCSKVMAKEELTEEEIAFMVEENRTWVFNSLHSEVNEQEHFQMIQEYFKLNLDLINAILLREDIPVHAHYMQILSLLFGAMMDKQVCVCVRENEVSCIVVV
jgi:hypothetical protein